VGSEAHHERIFCRTCVLRGPGLPVAIRASGKRGDKGNQWRAGAQRQLDRPGPKAALEALEGSTSMATHGDGSCCLHIPQRRCACAAPSRPAARKSASKEVDSAAYRVIGYPALGP